jgi:20S proteasome alpha/beta subunit
LEALSDVNEM